MSDTEHVDETLSEVNDGWQTVLSRRTAKKVKVDVTIPEASVRASPSPARVPEPQSIIPFVVPHPQDRIFEKTRSLIIAHNRKTFAHYTDPLRIYAFAPVPTTYRGDESNTIDLALVYRQKGLRIPFKLVRRSQEGKVDVVECEVKGGWQQFAKWLDGLKAPPGREVTGQKGLQLQQQWWDKTGKRFPLMTMATELRILILEQAVGPVLYPSGIGLRKLLSYGLGTESPTYSGSSADSINIDHTKQVAPRPNVDFIFTYRQLYEQVKHHLHYAAAKAFEDPTRMTRYVHNYLPNSPGNLRHLQHLDLDFDQRDYIHFFDVRVAPFKDTNGLDTNATRGDAVILSQFTELKSLKLHFRSTIGAAEDSAWRYTGRHNGHEWFCDFGGARDWKGFTTPCQKIVVDWILTYAKDYIQHIPMIILTGYIKDSTRERWNSILADERSGIHHDMRPEKQVIETWPTSDLPPQCHCSNPCDFSGYRSVVSHRECRQSWPHCNCKPIPEKFADKLISKYEFDYKD